MVFCLLVPRNFPIFICGAKKSLGKPLMLNQCLFILFDNVHKILENRKMHSYAVQASISGCHYDQRCQEILNSAHVVWKDYFRNGRCTVCAHFFDEPLLWYTFYNAKECVFEVFFLGEIRTWWVLLRAWWHCVQFWRKIKNEKGHIRRLVSHTSSWGKRVIFTHCFTH